MPRYRLLDGTSVSLSELSPEERDFIRTLERKAKKGTDYFDVEREAIGPGSLALGGRNRIDRRIVTSDLYRIARDIAKRVGLAQGLFLAPEFEAHRGELPTDGSMISATQAADLIGISRAAVHKAFNEGRLAGLRVGNLVVISRKACEEYLATGSRGSGNNAQKAPPRRTQRVQSERRERVEALAATTRHK